MRSLMYSLLLLAVFLAPLMAQDVQPTEHPFLWKIEGDTPSYLYGTIHVPDPRVTTLPEAVKSALAECDALYTELPLDMATQLGMAQKFMLSKGTLKDVLPPDLYEAVQNEVKKAGFPFMGFSRMKVWAVSVSLPQLAQLKKAMEKGPGGAQALDAMLYAQATAAGKEVGGLETVDEQIGIFDSATLEEQIEGLRSALAQLEKAGEEDPVESLIQTYLEGDLQALVDLLAQLEEGDASESAKALNRRLIEDRNRIMADRIREKLAAHPDKTYFFAVGCLHYPGEEGILELLEKEGLRVTRIGEPVAVPEGQR